MDDGYDALLLSFGVEELATDEKDEVNGEEDEVWLGRPDGSRAKEPRLVERGVSPRRALGPGAGSPQADCCPLAGCAPELLFELEAIEF